MSRPRFITLEGGEGAGKSTQARWLAQALEQAGMPTLTTREPGGSTGGEAIRQLVVSGATDKWHPVTESLLFMAARFDHLETKITPALANGQWVVCDRFYDSTYVYQGLAKNVGIDWLDQLYAHLFGNLAPDLTLWLDLPPSVGLARTDKRGNIAESRFESMGLEYHERLRTGFAALAHAHPARIQRIDAEPSMHAVHRALVDTLNTRFNLTLTPVEATHGEG